MTRSDSGLPLFVYGTLMFPAVRRKVYARTLTPGMLREAALPGHRAVRVAGAAYPTAVAAEGALLSGLLLPVPSVDDWERLRTYEGPEYGIVEVTVTLASGGSCRAVMFAGARPARPLENWIPRPAIRRSGTAGRPAAAANRGPAATDR